MKIYQASPIQPIPKLTRDEPASRAEGATKFYLRRPNKQTIIVYEASRLKGVQLLKLVQQKMQVNLDDLVLFLKGERIENKEKCQVKTYELAENDIVHVHNSKNFQRSQINIILKPYQCSIKIEQLFCISVKTEQKIRQSLEKHLQLVKQMAFVESGRVLDLQKTFKEESVEDESEIIITTFNEKNEKKEKKQSEDQLDIMQFGLLQSLKPAPRMKANQFQDFHSGNFPKPALRKSMTWSIESCNLNVQELNFKKKQKPSIYKSMKILDGKQIVWESDGSADLNGSLLQKMPIRRPKNQDNKDKDIPKKLEVVELKKQQNLLMMESEESSSDELNQNSQLLSSSERKVIRNQLSKLLSSDNNEAEKLMTKLQPPQMLDDDFLEESEEIQIVADEEDDDLSGSDEQPSSAPRPNSSVDLRQSIGKSRGEFVLPMIPTRDFDMREDSDDSNESDEEQWR